jgi:hypothetical protein
MGGFIRTDFAWDYEDFILNHYLLMGCNVFKPNIHPMRIGAVSSPTCGEDKKEWVD